MAIKLQPATLSEPFSYISLHDDALDMERPTFADEFALFKDGVGPPPLKEGVEPTVWELQPIADAQLQGILDGVREEHGRTLWFIATACVGIVGVSGAPKELGKIERIRSNEGYQTLSKRQQDMLGGALLAELGVQIIAAAVVNPT